MTTSTAAVGAAAAAARRRFRTSPSILRRSHPTPPNATPATDMLAAVAGAANRLLQNGIADKPHHDQIQYSNKLLLPQIHHSDKPGIDFPGVEEAESPSPRPTHVPCLKKTAAVFGCCGRWKSMAFRPSPSNINKRQQRGYRTWKNYSQGPPPICQSLSSRSRRSNHTPTNQISEMVTAGAGAGNPSRRRSRQHTSPLDGIQIQLQLQPGPQSMDCTALLNNKKKPQIQPGPQSAMLSNYTTILGGSLSDDLRGLEQTQHMVVEYKKQPKCPRRPPAFGCCGRWKSMAFRPSNGFGLHTRGYHIWTNMEQGPPPTTLLSFHREYDFNLGGWIRPELYFKIHDMVRKIHPERLIRQEDGDYYLFSHATRMFLKPLLELAECNNKRDYCIAPSLTLDNIRVSIVSGTCALVEPRFYYIGEMTGTQRIDKATSYQAVIDVLEQLIRITQADDVLGNLCPSIQNLFYRIRVLRRYLGTENEQLYESVINNHPCTMPTIGSVNLLTDADMILRHRYQHAEDHNRRSEANRVLRSLPYLGPEIDPNYAKANTQNQELWSDIADRHPLLRCWSEFKKETSNESDLAATTQKRNSNQQATWKRLKRAKGLVALGRNGVNHPFQQNIKELFNTALKEHTFKATWPYTMEEIVDVMDINLPEYRAQLVQGLIEFKHANWVNSGRHYCWPREDRCNCLNIPVFISPGTQAKLLKLGREDIWITLMLIGDAMYHEGGLKVPEEREEFRENLRKELNETNRRETTERAYDDGTVVPWWSHILIANQADAQTSSSLLKLEHVETNDGMQLVSKSAEGPSQDEKDPQKSADSYSGESSAEESSE